MADTTTKLEYLESCGALPLRRHQAYGSLFARIPQDNGSAGDDAIILLNDGADGDLPCHVPDLSGPSSCRVNVAKHFGTTCLDFAGDFVVDFAVDLSILQRYGGLQEIHREIGYF